MSRLKRVLGISVGLFVAVLTLGTILPSQVHVERKITLPAPPQEIFPLIADFDEWNKWSPWAELDPDIEIAVTGSELGQKMVWSSDDPRVFQGSQEFTLWEAPHRIKTHLDFGSQGEAEATFSLVAENNQTEVTWSWDADMRAGIPIYIKPLGAYFGLLMDGMVGNDYEQGLKNLQTLVQGLKPIKSAT